MEQHTATNGHGSTNGHSTNGHSTNGHSTNGRPGRMDTMGLRTFLIFGATADIGKTVIATALCNETTKALRQPTQYLKPNSVEPEFGADSRCELAPTPGHVQWFSEAATNDIQAYDEETPDLDVIEQAQAARNNADPLAAITNDTFVDDVKSFITGRARDTGGWMFIELLGGVNTPVYTGPPQADVYRPLGLPVVLVGAFALDGVSLTLSAWDSLRMRGYRVVALVVFEEERWKNYRYLVQHFRHYPALPVIRLPLPPVLAPELPAGAGEMGEYYRGVLESGCCAGLVRVLGHCYGEDIAE
ncbi:AAA domain-containing protein [Parachaetomium inaequale]|uniref:AAA domain-containing protein n=1 Tax=Parachaetomium inaequale TaxID=2588326 RepID=A0AAN6P7U5_9PEZI|nr:AAA domain-containing protein [Parachaetomium inaequale]